MVESCKNTVQGHNLEHVDIKKGNTTQCSQWLVICCFLNTDMVLILVDQSSKRFFTNTTK